MTVFGILSTPRQNNRVLPIFEALKQTYLLRMDSKEAINGVGEGTGDW